MSAEVPWEVEVNDGRHRPRLGRSVGCRRGRAQPEQDPPAVEGCPRVRGPVRDARRRRRCHCRRRWRSAALRARGTAAWGVGSESDRCRSGRSSISSKRSCSSSSGRRMSRRAASLASVARNALASSLSQGPCGTPQQCLVFFLLPHRQGWLRPIALTGTSFSALAPIVVPRAPPRRGCSDAPPTPVGPRRVSSGADGLGICRIACRAAARAAGARRG